MSSRAEPRYRSQLLATGLAAAAAAGLLVATGAVDPLPAIGRLVEQSTASAVLAAVILGDALWVLLLIALRLRGTARQRTPAPLFRSGDGLDLAAACSALTAARAETPYAPVRALVWAMPALGFIGTASEMSRAIGGLGQAIGGTGGYDALTRVLVGRVIPPLAGAFGVTLFALGCSVVCHVLLQFAHTHEQRVLLRRDEAVLADLRRSAGRTDPARELRSAAQELRTAAHEQSRAARISPSALTGTSEALSSVDAGARIAASSLGELKRQLDAVNRRTGQGRDGLRSGPTGPNPGGATGFGAEDRSGQEVRTLLLTISGQLAQLEKALDRSYLIREEKARSRWLPWRRQPLRVEPLPGTPAARRPASGRPYQRAGR
ncbi:hypothetical protein [Phaeacidiphilus oryzae]|uniref:hypothetical protein n=1 Tax=Phaeacidiphilus oryzae TaxID=348818 RepID=UPI00056D891C|nr:hypothetical protein [Phaeacidiphilus oryzae]